jgi:hypothetical protein
VTIKVADNPLLAILKAPLVPPVTTMSSEINPVTGSLNVNVKVTSSTVVNVAAETLSVMVTLGEVVSGVVPPPPHADSKAAAAMAQPESLKFKLVN